MNDMGGRVGTQGVFVYLVYWFPLLYFSEALPCLNGWVSYQEKCYFFSEHTDSWFGASAFCQAFNSKLAEPKTQEEVDFLSQQTVLQGNNSAYNIGVTDLFLEGDWVYAHSRTPVEVALPWTNGGPDNYKEEDCVEIAAFPPYSGQYADKSCPLPSKFICEYSRVEQQQALVIG
nr:C-type lectin domain family 17, member A-like isoform X1 [Crassostrea gigas]